MSAPFAGHAHIADASGLHMAGVVGLQGANGLRRWTLAEFHIASCFLRESPSSLALRRNQKDHHMLFPSFRLALRRHQPGKPPVFLVSLGFKRKPNGEPSHLVVLGKRTRHSPSLWVLRAKTPRYGLPGALAPMVLKAFYQQLWRRRRRREFPGGFWVWLQTEKMKQLGLRRFGLWCHFPGLRFWYSFVSYSL